MSIKNYYKKDKKY